MWHVRQGSAATLRAGKDFTCNILPEPINTIISVCAPAPSQNQAGKKFPVGWPDPVYVDAGAYGLACVVGEEGDVSVVTFWAILEEHAVVD